MNSAPRPHWWINGPRDGLFDLLSPLLGPDAEDDDQFVDRSHGHLPPVDETLEFDRDDGTPTWWPSSDDIRGNDILRGLGRASWDSAQQRRDVLYAHLRTRLPASLVTPRTFADRHRIVDALRAVYAGLLGRGTDWLR